MVESMKKCVTTQSRMFLTNCCTAVTPHILQSLWRYIAFQLTKKIWAIITIAAKTCCGFWKSPSLQNGCFFDRIHFFKQRIQISKLHSLSFLNKAHSHVANQLWWFVLIIMRMLLTKPLDFQKENKCCLHNFRFPVMFLWSTTFKSSPFWGRKTNVR